METKLLKNITLTTGGNQITNFVKSVFFKNKEIKFKQKFIPSEDFIQVIILKKSRKIFQQKIKIKF